MALQKPQKSKAQAFVQPAGGYHDGSKVADPCCIPSNIEQNPLVANASPDSAGGPEATHHIMNPTAH